MPSPRSAIAAVSPGHGYVSFAHDLSRHGANPAFVSQAGTLTYGDLADSVASFASRLGQERRLTLMEIANTAESLAAYLGAFTAGHAVILLAPGTQATVEELTAAYAPDTVVTLREAGVHIDARHEAPAHELHPDLALLLSTSGSTGSAKLVRLSYTNLQANAAAIAEYLTLTPADRAITTLPPHYCYGLSVIHSYLNAGASIALTDLSVSDDAFWEQFRRWQPTSFAGVPYTFDLLDRVGFASFDLPSLRYVTQAGGRLDPQRVRDYALHGQRAGWELFVMYGQTEATARMAYLPPHAASQHPQCIGVAIPGGSFRLEPQADWPGSDTGELIFSGPNVMLGYASTPADLAAGAQLTELATGDIARRTESGLLEIVGRKSRFLKLFGLRIDLQRVEQLLAGDGIEAVCTGSDEFLAVAVGSPAAARQAKQRLTEATGLPPAAIRVVTVNPLPRLANGKPDYQQVMALAAATTAAAKAHSDPVTAIFQDILAVRDVPETSTFAELGGDSLSYVQASIRLEEALGKLPPQWPNMPVAALRELAGGKRATPTLDTSIALRAIAILLIVASHADLFTLRGGAHMLLGIAGFNYGRFMATASDRAGRASRVLKSVARVAIPAGLWAGLALLVVGDYAWPNIFLANFIVGTEGANSEWVFWFLEAVVYITIAVTGLLALRPMHALALKHPFALPFGLFLAGLPARYDLIPGVSSTVFRWTPVTVFWLFALGWAIAKATTGWQRAALTVAIAAVMPGAFAEPSRELIVATGLILVIWLPAVPSTRWLNRIAGVLAASSFYIFLTHWVLLSRIERGIVTFLPWAEPTVPLAKFAISIAFGIAFTAAVNWLWERRSAAQRA